MEPTETTAASDSSDKSPGDDAYAAHLERSRRVWDRWSDWYGLSESDFEPIRERAIDRLALESGDRVLDIGCGPGVNFAYVREKIGSAGHLVAVDYSPEMVAKARARVDDHGWDNVEVRRADATTVAFDERFDAAIATLSLSVMPDVDSTLETVRRHVAPGSPVAVVDVRPAPSGPARLLNPLIWRFFRWYANWNPEQNVLASLRAVFDECEVVETNLAGVSYTAICRTADSRETRPSGPRDPNR
ncbi:methyltransferase domain-containing protein [Salinadaptatus halalkaliphilus]|uniref:Methyltransferase domain-containing protein n=2 Tax=Salinadaptatus halalkaliphilus TaxID=2419781 RepID=A0A4S3TR81_9EURY|nr:class I SAM-dependent methyltransferase [Salinadaptatus halalkaliphilus]THE65805.1 methyltransferase domain-containing protein [Salinadaptatus halalkaliphilus]